MVRRRLYDAIRDKPKAGEQVTDVFQNLQTLNKRACAVVFCEVEEMLHLFFSRRSFCVRKRRGIPIQFQTMLRSFSAVSKKRTACETYKAYVDEVENRNDVQRFLFYRYK